MSLGVLNNLSAMYAANNLNNTSNSLNTVLQQLSSGSKINSGADDAAGLSLVNGLQANSVALAQSQTNAAEGVGLLKVADGALSQVTNLLNRAVTLATEASNGTLNASQDAAANSEYQSILSEISNIGTTTTYNGQTVFGSTTNIYTGDSSAAGASIDALNIRSLSSSNVGNSGGQIHYSNGADNVFINLSTSSTNAKATDYLGGGATGKTTIDVSYLVKGANGTSTPASTSITVGDGSNYANTANGLISAINNSGLGMSATFATQTEAGVQGGGTQTGIEISGGQVAVGTAASGVSTSGILNPAGIANSELLTQQQVFTFSQGGTSVGSVTIDQSNNTLGTLATAIGAATGGKVTATVITNGDGSQSLALGNSLSTQGALTVGVQAGTVTPPSLGTATGGFTAPVLNTTSGGVGANAGSLARAGSATFAVAGANSGTTVLSDGGSITITSAQGGTNVTDTFIIGANNTGSPAAAGTYYTGNGVNTMDGLVNFIKNTANLNVNNAETKVTSAGLTITSTTAATGYNVTIASNSTLTNASNKLGIYSPSDGGAATVGTATTTELNAGAAASQNDRLSGTITFSANLGQDTLAFTAGTNGNTYSDLVTYINTNSSALGVTAEWSNTMGTGGTDHGILLTSVTNDGKAPVVTVGTDTLGDATTGMPNDTTITSVYGGTNAKETDVVSGSFSFTGIGNDGASHSVNFTQVAGDGKTFADLENAINTANVGVVATWSNNSMLLTSTTPGASQVLAPAGTLLDETNATGASSTVSNFYTVGGGALATDFVQGTATFTANGKNFIYTGDGTTTDFNDLATALTQSGLGVTASFAGGHLEVTSLTNSNDPISIAGTLQDKAVGGAGATVNVTFDAAAGTNRTGSTGMPVTVAVDQTKGGRAGTNGTLLTVETVGGTSSSAQGTAGAGPSYATAILQLDQTGSLSHNIVRGDPVTGVGSDTITGQITIHNGNVAHTFIQGTGTDDATTKYTGGDTVAALTAAINADTVLGLSATAPGGGTGGIYLQASTPGLDTISASGSTLADVGNGAGVDGVLGAAVTGRTVVSANAAALTVGLASGAMSAAPDPSLTVNSNDVLKAGSAITVGFGAGNSQTFVVGTAPGSPAANTTYVGSTAAGATLSQLATAITNSTLGVSATAGTNGLELTSTGTPGVADQMITATAIDLTDNSLGTFSKMSLSGFGSENDTVSGHLDYSINSVTHTPLNLVSGETVSQMIAQINLASNNTGITAAWNAGTKSVDLTSGTEGALGNIAGLGTTSVTDTSNTAILSYVANNAYSIGISGDSTNKLYDSTAGQTSSTVAGVVANQMASSGVATISYTDGAGQSLAATDLSNATDARAALTALNAAITAVAAQDGYIGAQINTLNAVSSVLSTQQQNVVSAQNAVQATDYASAASNMSKYEILSQTGISALAQANSMQREVTKLLQ